jgi:hypothetical protein
VNAVLILGEGDAEIRQTRHQRQEAIGELKDLFAPHRPQRQPIDIKSITRELEEMKAIDIKDGGSEDEVKRLITIQSSGRSSKTLKWSKTLGCCVTRCCGTLLLSPSVSLSINKWVYL